jgi:3-polyprenyl-4-hydroxybenzoate decarboxylase
MIIVGISGASGPIMGIRLIEELLLLKEEVIVVASPAARRIIGYEILGADTLYPGLADIIRQRNRAVDFFVWITDRNLQESIFSNGSNKEESTSKIHSRGSL